MQREDPLAALPHAPTLADGRYKLVARLGHGGMAAVYRAWDTRLRRWRAVKVLLPDFAKRPKLRQRFENEAALMARIEHRHVIAVDDVGTSDALPWIVMELADGGSLADWCAVHGPMPPRVAVDVAMQVCKGLAAAHEVGVIHRDVKPHNVLITSRGVCKVTDFGIARALEHDMTRTGSVMGTLGYMAPEQRADAKAVDARADVYGVGATLYHLLTARSVADLFLAEHDATLLDGVPEVLAPIVRKSAAYHPEDRYPDVTTLARDLFAARASLPPVPEDTPPLPLPAHALAAGPASEPSEPTFPEIEALLGAPAPAADQPADRSDRSDRPVLPYVMPDRLASSDETPSWLDPSELDERPRHVPIELGAELGAEPEEGASEPDPDASAATKDEEPGDLDAAENFVDLVGSIVLAALKAAARPLAAFGLPVAGLMLLGGLLVGTSAWNVRAAASEAHRAREALYDTLHAERIVIDDLAALGANRGALEAIFRAWEGARDEPERMSAALRVVSMFAQERRVLAGRAGPGRTHKVQMAQQRLERLDAAITAYEQAMLAWEQAADSDRGRLAVRLGVADPPE